MLSSFFEKLNFQKIIFKKKNKIKINLRTFSPSPTPEVTWHKIDQSRVYFLGHGNELFLEQVTANHSGFYECRAKNNYHKYDYDHVKNNMKNNENIKNNKNGDHKKRIHLKIESKVLVRF